MRQQFAVFLQVFIAILRDAIKVWKQCCEEMWMRCTLYIVIRVYKVKGGFNRPLSKGEYMKQGLKSTLLGEKRLVSIRTLNQTPLATISPQQTLHKNKSTQHCCAPSGICEICRDPFFLFMCDTFLRDDSGGVWQCIGGGWCTVRGRPLCGWRGGRRVEKIGGGLRINIRPFARNVVHLK